jgi:hypothetical protein
VAAEFPELCEAETEAFSRLLDTPVQRLATIAHGDGICTTHVTCSAHVTGKPDAPQTVVQHGVSTRLAGTGRDDGAPAITDITTKEATRLFT